MYCGSWHIESVALLGDGQTVIGGCGAQRYGHELCKQPRDAWLFCIPVVGKSSAASNERSHISYSMIAKF